MTLPSQALAYHRRSSGLSALAARAVLHRSADHAAAATVKYQQDAAQLAIAFGQRVLTEQGSDPAGQTLDPAAFTAVPDDLSSLYDGAPNRSSLSRLAGTLVSDAGRSAMGVFTTSRDTEYGTVRVLVGASCGRCAVLAGRWYRWSEGFQRHPKCDCTNVPSSRSHAAQFAQNPSDMFEQGLIRGLTQREQQAIRDGADISQVINARSGMRMINFSGRSIRITTSGTTARGLAGRQLGDLAKVGGTRYRVSQRIRLTPETIYRLSGDDRVMAIRLLQANGYVL